MGHQLPWAYRTSLLQSAVEEAAYLFLQAGERVALDVHHVSRVIVAERNLLVLRRREIHVVERVLSGKKRRRQIVVAVGDEELHVRILDEGEAQRFAGVGETFSG